MKVYESSHPTKRDYTKVPQIKIKNQKLEEFGFTAGTEFKIIYTKNKILLKVIEREVNYVR
ncbi:MAG: hypothetical protein WBV81_18100 [Ignavibacteriaceae bacterium]